VTSFLNGETLARRERDRLMCGGVLIDEIVDPDLRLLDLANEQSRTVRAIFECSRTLLANGGLLADQVEHMADDLPSEDHAQPRRSGRLVLFSSAGVT
jgi:hypothetical protein